ncbi:UNVERIFIED_CONTAM: hypothetical protein ITH36_24625, partial [Salmonella enterica subsp. enterica serovar Weltevreden]
GKTNGKENKDVQVITQNRNADEAMNYGDEPREVNYAGASQRGYDSGRGYESRQERRYEDRPYSGGDRNYNSGGQQGNTSLALVPITPYPTSIAPLPTSTALVPVDTSYSVPITQGQLVQSGPPEWVNSFQQNMLTAMDQKFGTMDQKLGIIDHKFNAIDQKF